MPAAPPELEPGTLKSAPPASLAPALPPRAQTRTWWFTAIVAAAFTASVGIGMLVGHERSVAEEPLRAREIQALRERLHADAKNDALKKQIREVDLRERERYFTRVRRNAWGAWMLLGGGAVFVIAASQARAARRRVPVPRALASGPAIEQETKRSRAAVMAAGAAVMVGIVGAGLVQPRMTTSATRESASLGALVRPAAWSPELARQNWPRFRGADGSGVSASTNIPLTWDVATGENVTWKSPVPLPGPNSPVVWGDRVFLTGSDARTREVFCFDSADGALLWRLPARLVSSEAAGAMDIPKLTGAAAATAAADDQRVFAIFGTGELIAADHNGRIVWSRNFGKLENMYGHAASLVVWRDRLIVQLDQGDEESGKSRLYAFDSATGKVVWQQKRMLASSWTTPIIIEAAGREQIICLGEPWLISYDASSGSELWRFGEFGSDLTPSPVFAAGLVFAVSPNQELYAIRLDGSGDVSKTHRAWSIESNVPDITSPVSDGGLLFTLESYGIVACFEAATGKKLWEHEYEAEFNASPVIVGERLYVMSTDGEVFVLRAGREFQELARASFGEAVKASPAFAGDRMFVRGATNLFCIAAIAEGGAR